MGAEKADACRRNCTKASCGDGVTDTGEQCDEGPSGGLNCTKECQAICPVLPNVTNATISYGGGRVYGTHVSYVCNGTDLIPDGSSTRSCLANGTWNGTATTTCECIGCCKCTRFPNSKILTKASWDDQINSWLPSNWQNKKWVLCYSSHLHPTDKASQFHSRCDAYTGTISLGWNINHKKTFGAFHEGTWAGSGVYDENAKADFLFKLGDSLEKFPNKGSGNYAYKRSAYWPLFGGGHDLSWGWNGKLGTNAHCNAYSYSGHVNNEICGGNDNWGTTHLEVWRLA